MSTINCQTCGASTDFVIANCKYCGVEISKAQALTPQEYVAAVGRAIQTARAMATSVDKDEDEIATLQSIPIPSDIPTLAAFFMFCHGNVKGGIEGMNRVPIAWRSKTKGVYDALRLASLNNLQLSSFLEDFKSEYSAEGMRKQDRVQYYFYGVFGFVIILVLIMMMLDKK